MVAADGLDNHGGAVAQNFRRSDHRAGIVAHPDHGIAADIPGVSEHQFEGLLARLFAKAGEDAGPAAEQGAERPDNGERQRSRAHRDAAHDAETFDDAIAGKLERRRRRHRFAPVHGRVEPRRRRIADDHLIACGLIGEPVPPVMMSGGPQKKNS